MSETEKKTYSVTMPIGGHAIVSVEANSEEEAIALAIDKVTYDDIETWDAARVKVIGRQHDLERG